MSAPFAGFAAVMERIRQARGPSRQATLWDLYCSTLTGADRSIALDFLEGRFSTGLPWTSLRLPRAALLMLLSDLSGWDHEIIGWVLKAERSIPSAFGALLPERKDDPRLSLAHVADICAELASLKGARRLPVLHELLRHSGPPSAKSILQLLSRTLPYAPTSLVTPSEPVATFCVAIIAATSDHAERTTLLSDYTIAVLDGESFFSVGTVWEGLEPPEVETISKLLQSIPGERRGDAWLVEPRIVLEVSCTGVRINRRRQSGLELCGARIQQWRTDCRSHEIATFSEVLALSGRQALPADSAHHATLPPTINLA